MTLMTDCQNPLRPGQVTRLGGFVGERWQANRTGSIDRLNIDTYLRMLETPTHRDWWWIGEQPGKWLESAVLTSAASHDAGLRERASVAMRRMVAAQSSDGYLGITDPALRSPVTPLRGMDAYEQYFTLHGLLTAYETLGEPAALSAATRMADYYLHHIGPGKAEFWPSPLRPPHNRRTIICKQWTWVPPGTPEAPTVTTRSEIAGHTAHYGWEGTLVIDPILRLHALTGEPRFLEFSQWVVGRIDEWSGWDAFSRLDDVAAGNAGVHELQPYVHAHTFHMNFLGFLRLYRATGDTSLLRKVAGAWNDIAARQMYVTGGVSAGEHYKPGYERPLTGHVVETCANMSWMQLSQELLCITGESRYADVVERLLLNHLFASQAVDGDSYRYHTPPNGTKPGDYFHGPDCCTSSGHRAVSLLPSLIYATLSDAIVVNQYVPSEARIDRPDLPTVVVRQETDYPAGELVVLRVEASEPVELELRLRIPAWCEGATIEVAGQPTVACAAGGYASVRRTWHAGDTLTLRLPQQWAWIEHGHLPVGQERLAIQRGPVIYAVDTLWWDDPSVSPQASVDHGLRVPAGPLPAIELAAAPAGCLGPAARTRLLTADGRTVRPLLVPFANVGRWYRDSAQRPDPASAAFSYAIWLNRA